MGRGTGIAPKGLSTADLVCGNLSARGEMPLPASPRFSRAASATAASASAAASSPSPSPGATRTRPRSSSYRRAVSQARTEAGGSRDRKEGPPPAGDEVGEPLNPHRRTLTGCGFPLQPTKESPAGEAAEVLDELDLADGQRITALIHMYRAEQGKMTAYRLRMDTSTNWAVSVTGVLTVFSLGEGGIPHWFFLFIAFMNVVFMLIESRHFAVFIAHRARIRLLERGFYCRAVLWERDEIQADLHELANWQGELKETLLRQMDFSVQWINVYLRLTRNYAFLLTAVYIGWIFKLNETDSGSRHIATVWGGTTAVLLVIVAIVYLCRPSTDLERMGLRRELLDG